MPEKLSKSGKPLGPIGTRVLFENEHVRVWSVELGPKGHQPLHEHEHPYLVVPVSEGKALMRWEDGRERQITDVLGNALCREASGGPHELFNLEENSKMHSILVEIKAGARDRREHGNREFGEERMRLGMFMMPVHPPDRTFWSTLDEDTEKSLLADQLGFDELWLGEHFSASTEPIPSPLMFFSNLLHRTKHITFGTAVINIPNHHPAIVAAECAQFDHMSRGRFMLGVGPGGLVSDFELFKLTDHGARNRMVVEAVDMIQRIWTQDPPYALKGEFWDISIKDGINARLGVGFMPKPYQQPAGPPVFISLASPSSSSAKTAAEQGWGMISANIIPIYSVASHWTVYSDACRALGKTPNGEQLARRAQRDGGAVRRRGGRPRVRRNGVEQLFLHLHARRAEQRRPARRSSSRGPTCPTTKPRSRPSPPNACCTARPRPCSTSSWRSANASGRSAVC